MTNEEAHSRLEEKQRMMTQYRYLFSPKDIEANGLAIEALEKQIPKKPMEQFSFMPIYDDDGCSSDVLILYKAMCPNCNEELAYGELERMDCADIKFCSCCSQAIDWSDE